MSEEQKEPLIKPYFLYDPEGDGFMYFATEKERDYASEDIIQYYLDEGWAEEVEQVVAGKLTHNTVQCDRVDRPDNIDECGFDEDGCYWHPDWKYLCDYKLQKIEGE